MCYHIMEEDYCSPYSDWSQSRAYSSLQLRHQQILLLHWENGLHDDLRLLYYITQTTLFKFKSHHEMQKYKMYY